MKLVSIIIPYFKKKQYLYKTVCSAINQTYSNIEILIIYDDEDRTDLKTFRKKFQNFKKVKFIVNKKNIGAGLARNIGIKYAKGKFIAFLDSDDLWKKNKIRKQVDFINLNKIDLCYTNYYGFDDKKVLYKVNVQKSGGSVPNIGKMFQGVTGMSLPGMGGGSKSKDSGIKMTGPQGVDDILKEIQEERNNPKDDDNESLNTSTFTTSSRKSKKKKENVLDLNIT